MNPGYRITKRAMDLVLTLAAFLVLSPLFVVISLVLLATGEHQVFYRQRRIGLNGREFGLLKFVTMRRNSEAAGTITVKNDPRILPVGDFLRRTKLNELPQLLNVIVGQMSIIGPRPLVQSEVELYPDECRRTVYSDNKPGLSGMGSLFFRNEEDILEGFSGNHQAAYRDYLMPVKCRLELWYREHKNLLLDMKIILLTILAVGGLSVRRVVSLFDGPRGLSRSTIDAYLQLLCGEAPKNI